MKHLPLRIYVAGASNEREDRAKPVMRELRDLGLVITHDWTSSMDNPVVGPDHALTPEQKRKYTEVDLLGVRTADFMLLLVPYNHSAGAWVELGFAFGLNIPVIACGGGDKRLSNIFISKACREFDLDAQGVKFLYDLQVERG
jgi:nucleoside 2-deoxyribosyltransferase